jgi:hypothetical protein
MGWLKTVTHHYTTGLWVIAAAMALGGWLVYGESVRSPVPTPQAAD